MAVSSDHDHDARGARWAELLDVAARVFRERGYAGATMQEIADELGILKGSLYHYIDSKQELLFQVVKDSHDAGLVHVAACRALEGDALARLEAFIRGHVAIMIEDQVRIAVYLSDAGSLEPERRAIVEHERAAYEDYVVELVREGQAAGLFRAELDPSLTALGLLGMLNWTYRWYRPESGTARGDATPADAEAIADAYLALALGGLVRA